MAYAEDVSKPPTALVDAVKSLQGTKALGSGQAGQDFRNRLSEVQAAVDRVKKAAEAAANSPDLLPVSGALGDLAQALTKFGATPAGQAVQESLKNAVGKFQALAGSVDELANSPEAKALIPQVRDLLNSGPANSGSVKPGPTKPGPTKPGPTKPGPTKPGPTNPCPDTPGPVKSGSDTPGPVKSGSDTPGPVKSGSDTPGPVKSGSDTPGPVKSGPANSGPPNAEAVAKADHDLEAAKQELKTYQGLIAQAKTKDDPDVKALIEATAHLEKTIKDADALKSASVTPKQAA
ncbi:hypothetical protein [Amycolatopsis sp. cmx-11-12]|uniref:hypothetical protein n=1 Tax=Amycolatopsis sp. cmx-11-12 TaxID=2785795 RepID=UPI0039185DF7